MCATTENSTLLKKENEGKCYLDTRKNKQKSLGFGSKKSGTNKDSEAMIKIDLSILQKNKLRLVIRHFLNLA